ncbi:hypothetical protein VitviT2T_011458 [Vitis vinifera]|uniref:Reverse transcriptase Ty1/copia-type domain-containing protein n=1 Tax=Vitis vinifera TaxID=29760 RepID=A0ABY9CCL6_VITVI|nr:hypothetical protein VitviT2T_011458 [Vitis vinifera]
MDEEVQALQTNRTWILVHHLTNTNIVGSKWVFQTKYLPDGSIELLKARLVAKGYTQVPGLNYTDTFSPVIKATTICVVLSLAVTNKWSRCQLDVKNAFLNGHLTEHVYMEQPPRYIEPRFPNHYLTITRPDIAHVVNSVNQFLHSPTEDHFLAIKRILRYVKSTLHFGLTLHPSAALGALVAYFDVDWAGCLDTRRSTSGYSIYLSDNLVSWSAKKQPTVSYSSWLEIFSNVDEIQVATEAENVNTVARIARIENDCIGLGLGERTGRIGQSTGSAEEPKLSGIQGVVKVTSFW